jgi:hypothetical protein
MRKLFQLLWIGHEHKWKIIEESSFQYEGSFSSYRCIRYYLQCEVCGDVKIRDMR